MGLAKGIADIENIVVKTVDGREIEVMTVWHMYQTHLRDYDLDSVHEITQSPKALIEQLAGPDATPRPEQIAAVTAE